MSDERLLVVPKPGRWMIAVASWIVPASSREDWRREWLAELWHWYFRLPNYAESSKGRNWRLSKHCWGAFADAAWLQFNPEELRANLLGLVARPGFCFAVIGILFLGLLLGTRGLEHSRASLSNADRNRIVLLSQSIPLLGQRFGVSLDQVSYWRQESSTMDGIAVFSFRKSQLAAPNSSAAEVLEMQVDSYFFRLLGEKAFLGHTLRADDGDPEATGIVLSHALWQKRFGADPAVVGRSLTLNAHPVNIIGILRPQVWPVCHPIGVWTLLPTSQQPMSGRSPRLLGAVGRLKEGITKAEAESELRAISQRRKGCALVELALLRERLEQPLRFYGTSLTLMLLPLLGWAGIRMVGLLSKRRNQKRRAYSLAYWCFFFAKTLLITTLVSLLWHELTTAMPIPVTGGWDFTTAFVLSSFFLASALALWWSMRDQKHRCRSCLTRLSMPVAIGSWSSSLLERPGIELVCPHGHGSLFLSEIKDSYAEQSRWTAFDGSWRHLFHSAPK